MTAYQGNSQTNSTTGDYSLSREQKIKMLAIIHLLDECDSIVTIDNKLILGYESLIRAYKRDSVLYKLNDNTNKEIISNKNGIIDSLEKNVVIQEKRIKRRNTFITILITSTTLVTGLFLLK